MCRLYIQLPQDVFEGSDDVVSDHHICSNPCPNNVDTCKYIKELFGLGEPGSVSRIYFRGPNLMKIGLELWGLVYYLSKC